MLGWLHRAETSPLVVGHFWYIVSMDWWNSWADYCLGQVGGGDWWNNLADYCLEHVRGGGGRGGGGEWFAWELVYLGEQSRGNLT